jgi:hypothetical protein
MDHRLFIKAPVKKKLKTSKSVLNNLKNQEIIFFI